MPRYFFDVYDGRRALRDDAGAELDGPEDAHDEAAALLPEFARGVLPKGQSHDFGAAVRDEAGRTIYRAVLVFRGEADPPVRPAYRIRSEGGESEVMRAIRLQHEARTLGARLTSGIAGLLDALEAVSANAAASSRMIAPRDGD